MLALLLFSCSKEVYEVQPPKLTNNPSYDVICTNLKPLLSFFVAHGGIGEKKYVIQLDTDPEFKSANLIEYKGVKKLNKYLVEKRVQTPLIDKTRYYWRAKAIDVLGKQSTWSQSRFFINTNDV